MANGNLGSIVPQGNFLRIDNALVEEVSAERNTGFLIVSYSVLHPSGITTIEQLRLNVSNSTVILNSFRFPMCLCDIQAGMRIDATFSPRMTRSLPPQSNAFIIIVRTPSRPSQPASNVSTERVLRVDVNNNQLFTGMENNINSQKIFTITSSTVILNRNGVPISLRALRPGQLVRIRHANFQTASIPPQTTAFHIQVI